MVDYEKHFLFCFFSKGVSFCVHVVPVFVWLTVRWRRRKGWISVVEKLVEMDTYRVSRLNGDLNPTLGATQKWKLVNMPRKRGKF